MHLWLLDLLVCPECRGLLRLDAAEQSGQTVSAGKLSCDKGHTFPIVGGIPRFVQHTLDADQARTRDSFGYEWTKLYPEHGHTTPEWQAERDIFLEYTRTVPSDFRGKLVLDAGCGNGRYAKLANDWGSRVVAVDISSAVEIAQNNVGDRPDVTVVQADLFKLPFRPETFDIIYSIGVLHHTPDAKGAFERIQPLVRPGGFFSIFMHGQGNRALYAVNRMASALDRERVVLNDLEFLPAPDRHRQGPRKDSVRGAGAVSGWAAGGVLLSRSAQQFRPLQRRFHQLPSSRRNPRLVRRVG